jgi:O-glycosyl hydrolase
MSIFRTSFFTRRLVIGALASSAALTFAASGLCEVWSSTTTGTAVINGATRYQTMAGFGASEGFGQAAVIMGLAPAMQSQVLSLLYSRTSGAGLAILRNEISADSGVTIEPTEPSSPEAQPTYSPLGSDQGQEWLAAKIRADYGVTNVFADAWSAPAFMKTNGAVDNGGTLCGVPGAQCADGDWRQAYANYLVKYVRDYAADGIPLSYVGPENEANLAPGSYDGMTLTPEQSENFLDFLGPTLAASRLFTKVECCATQGWDEAQQYAAAIEADAKASSYTPLFTSHGYSAAPDSPLRNWTKPAWETEWSTFEKWDPAWDDGTDASGLTWAQNIYRGLANANLSGFLYWWGSGTTAVATDNESLIQINGSTVSPSGRLWAFASYSRFIRPGAVRIGAISPISAVELTAFRNTDGSLAVVAVNTANRAEAITYSLLNAGISDVSNVMPYLTNASSKVAAQAAIRVRGGRFAATIPARSVITYEVPSK